ncbi:MAG: hypothetical protein C0446_12255 [Chitinophaga sp.]|nr:hypothetical protein [Chitinophaga sp.]
MKHKMQDSKLRQYFILLFLVTLLSSGCGRTMYKLSGVKTARVENAGSILTFMQNEFVHFGQPIYIPNLSFDSSFLNSPFNSIANRFFDKQGIEWIAKDGDQDAFRFLHIAKQKDSLSTYYEKIDSNKSNIIKWAESFQQLNGQPIQASDLPSAEFTIIMPWMIYAYKALYKEEFQELKNIIPNYPSKIAVIQPNMDFNQAWGLPFGAKIPVKTKWNRKERSVETTYNILPLLQKKG